MAYTSQLKKGVDLPVWEWCRFSPAATTAVSTAATGGTGSRYLYYMVSGTCYRYDTVGDAWQTLASTAGFTAPQNHLAMQYNQQYGHSGRVISAGASTLEMAALEGQLLKGYTIRITSGTGAGQERTITNVALPVVADTFLVTIGTTSLIVDTLKQWKTNQWVGYQVRLLFGTGANAARTVLNNTQTTINVVDTSQTGVWPRRWGGFFPVTPAAGCQGVIESSIVTVNSAWDVQPDNTSEFMVYSGSLLVVTGTAQASSHVTMRYDIVSDTWFQQTGPTGLFTTSAALSLSEVIEGWNESTLTPFLSSTATSALSTDLVDSAQTMDQNTYANFRLRITGGTGIGQERTIIANSPQRFYVSTPWTTTPDNTSTYTVIGDYDKFLIGGSSRAGITMYSAESDMYSPSQIYEVGVPRHMAASKTGWAPMAVTSIARTTGGILTVASAPTVGGSGYRVGDILTVSTGGTLGKVRVTAVNATGAVTAIALENPGSTYTTGAGKATTGGSGTACTIDIQTIGDMATATTTAIHVFAIGDTVTIAGAGQAEYNGAKTILGANTATTFMYVVTGAPVTPATFTAQGATLVVDVTKNWAVNELVGKAIILQQPPGASGVGVWGIAKISSNTATTITVLTTLGTAAGTWRYAIVDLKMIGTGSSYYGPTKHGDGIATAGANSTLTDSTKNWEVNSFSGKYVRIIAGTGRGQEVVITSNTATVLTITGTWGVNPDATSVYSVEDCYGISTATSTTTLTDTTQNWRTNTLTTKGILAFAGTAANMEYSISSNTATVITGPVSTTVNGIYAVFDVARRGASSGVIWPCNQSDASKRGRYIYVFRGGGSLIMYERLNWNTFRWEYAFNQVGGETLTTGSMYAYDGADSIYITKDAQGRAMRLDLTTSRIEATGQIPYGHGTAVISNRMCVVTTEDGVKFLYMMRHSGQEMWRTLLFP